MSPSIPSSFSPRSLPPLPLCPYYFLPSHYSKPFHPVPSVPAVSFLPPLPSPSSSFPLTHPFFHSAHLPSTPPIALLFYPPLPILPVVPPSLSLFSLAPPSFTHPFSFPPFIHHPFSSLTYHLPSSSSLPPPSSSFPPKNASSRKDYSVIYRHV